MRPGPVEDLSEEDFRRSVDANLTATFLTIRSVLPGMKARGRGGLASDQSAWITGIVLDLTGGGVMV